VLKDEACWDSKNADIHRMSYKSESVGFRFGYVDMEEGG
jgi:hypothetical protein